jgi:hypothetical protein
MTTLKTSLMIGCLAVVAGCTNTGTLVVENRSSTTIPEVTMAIISDGGATQTLSINALGSGERRAATYAISSEYSLDIRITNGDGKKVHVPYGYVIDNWRNPTHTVVIGDSAKVAVDGEAQPPN